MHQETFDHLTPAQLAMICGPENVVIDNSIAVGEIQIKGKLTPQGVKALSGIAGSNWAHKSKIDKTNRAIRRKAAKLARRKSRS